jgi:hypothetical protein
VLGDDPYATQGRCPVCGATGPCPDGAPVPITSKPFDLFELDEPPSGGPLARYLVTLHGVQTFMLLNAADAAAYGDAAVLQEGP